MRIAAAAVMVAFGIALGACGSDDDEASLGGAPASGTTTQGDANTGAAGAEAPYQGQSAPSPGAAKAARKKCKQKAKTPRAKKKCAKQSEPAP